MTRPVVMDVIARDKATKTYNNVGNSVTKLAKDTNKSNDTIQRSAKKAGDANEHFAKVSSRAFISTGGHLRALAVISSGAFLAAAAGAFVAGKSFVKAANDQQKANAQTAAVIKSTGGAAHVTAGQIADLSGSISRLSGIQDDTVQASANMLLTFTNIRNEVGKGNDIFNRATQVVTDMSVAIGQDSTKSAIQLGKALNDPIKGVGALMRVGVTFDDAQKKNIKNLVEHGHRLEAQKIILKELTKEFGGSAAAQATAGAKMAAAWDQVKEKIGNTLNLALVPIANWFLKTGFPLIARAVDAGTKWIITHWVQIKEVFNTVELAVRAAAAKTGAAIGFLITNFIKPAVAWIKANWPQIKATFITVSTAIGTALAAVWKAILYFRNVILPAVVNWVKAHWPEISATFQKAWTQIKPTLDSLWKLLQALWNQIIKPFVLWIHTHWSSISAVIRATAIAVGIYLLLMNKAIQVLAKAITFMVNYVWGPQFRLMLHIVSGTAAVIIRIWNGLVVAWNHTFAAIKSIAGDLITYFQRLPGHLVAPFVNAGTWLYNKGKAILQGLWNGISALGKWLMDKIKSIIPGWIKTALGIASPPQWAIDFGGWIAKGLAHGITHKFPHFLGNLTKTARDKLAAVARSVGRGFGTDTGMINTMAVGQAVSRAMEITGVPSTWFDPIMRRIRFESGGNPMAINLTDINAQRGDPSRGLMQTIGATFRAFHHPGTSNNIYDPVANVAAAIDYIRSRYGSIFAIDPPIQGYEKGTRYVPQTGLALLHKGESVRTRAETASDLGGGDTYIHEVHVHGVQNTSQLWQELQKYAKRNGSLKLSGVTG